MVTYKQDYFNSPWNYFDCASIIIIAMLFLLHISRLNHEVRGVSADGWCAGMHCGCRHCRDSGEVGTAVLSVTIVHFLALQHCSCPLLSRSLHGN
jgi:hypothetical protein